MGRLFILEASGGGRLFSMNPDGSDSRTLVSGGRIPDGIVVDTEHGHLYWTNMGNPTHNDGSIERADLDGRNRKTVVPPGATFTPKQLHLDSHNHKLYWSDREGMRVMRSNLDGSQIETLVDSSQATRDRAPMRTNGVWVSRLMWTVGICIGLRRDRTTAGEAAFSGPIWRFPLARRPPIAATPPFCSIVCRSPSTWSWIWKMAISIGPIEATRHAATQSVAPPSTAAPARKSCSAI